MEKILIIEDDEPLRTYLAQFLNEEGYVVESAETGAKGLKYIEDHYPNLVILDLGLPDISGETVLTRVKSYYQEIPIIILTAKAGVEKIIAGLN